MTIFKYNTYKQHDKKKLNTLTMTNHNATKFAI